MWRFFGIFMAIQAVLFAAELTAPAQRALVQPLTGGLAAASGVVLGLVGREVTTAGVVIQDLATPFAIEIAAGCNGVEATILLAAGMLAFPAPWRYKLAGILIGVLAIQALNLVRLVSLFLLGIWNQTAFEWAHLYVWQGLIMLDALLVWLLWIRRLPRPDAAAPRPL